VVVFGNVLLPIWQQLSDVLEVRVLLLLLLLLLLATPLL
jgi:hypothetical protein